MAEKNSNTNPAQSWDSSVQFYFQVDFQSHNDCFQVSFMEVSGLAASLDIERRRDEFMQFKKPERIAYGNITFKRPLSPLPDSFCKWVKESFSYTSRATIKTYDVVIKLLGSDGRPLATWLCSHVYPVKWSLDSLNMSKDELSVESVVVTCSRLERMI